MNLESYLSHESVPVKCQLLNEHEPVLLLLPATLSNPLSAGSHPFCASERGGLEPHCIALLSIPVVSAWAPFGAREELGI